jgi:hypothetical protein
VDVVAFTASLQIERLMWVAKECGLEAELKTELARTPIASIGSVVQGALQKYGLDAAVQPRRVITSSRWCAPSPGCRQLRRTKIIARAAVSQRSRKIGNSRTVLGRHRRASSLCDGCASSRACGPFSPCLKWYLVSQYDT